MNVNTTNEQLLSGLQSSMVFESSKNVSRNEKYSKTI